MKYFLDTNILVYWLAPGSKADRAEELLAGNATISVQVLNELADVLVKKKAMPLADVEEIVATLLDTCEVQDLTAEIHVAALALARHYQLSVYDACIAASAGAAGCTVLYSEDLQPGLSVKMPAGLGVRAVSVKSPFV